MTEESSLEFPRMRSSQKLNLCEEANWWFLFVGFCATTSEISESNPGPKGESYQEFKQRSGKEDTVSHRQLSDFSQVVFFF